MPHVDEILDGPDVQGKHVGLVTFVGESALWQQFEKPCLSTLEGEGDGSARTGLLSLVSPAGGLSLGRSDSAPDPSFLRNSQQTIRE